MKQNIEFIYLVLFIVEFASLIIVHVFVIVVWSILFIEENNK
jgi:hypothetical protein